MVTTSDIPRTPGHRRRRASRLRPRPTGGTPAATPAAGPVWERPILAALLLMAAVLYSWGITHAAIHPYYSAAVRTMATSWHAFVYGGLDSGGSVTVDKLPGGLWPQALSVRVFGPHVWAVALPQVVEGLLTLVVLHRAVRAWAGPLAALLAVSVLAVTPVVVVLDRHTIPDTLLTLLLVCAAAALHKAVTTQRLLPLLACAVWVGMAFQAKMLQAWLVLPVFGLTYQLAAAGSRVQRALRLALAGAVALAVSCLWVLLVWATPTAHRPYMDGTSNDSPWSLVFGYNGLSRFGGSPTAWGAVPGTAASRATGNTGWTMLINHVVGPQIAWFLPLAVLATVLGLRWRAGRARTDALRSGFVMWGGWLLVHVAVFSASNGNHGYYTVVLAPAIAALSGAGVALFWAEYQKGGPRRAVLPAALALTVAWAVVLHAPHRGFAPGLLPAVLMLGLCGIAGLWARGPRTGRRSVLVSLVAGLAAALLTPAVWAASSLDPLYAGSAMSPLAGPVGTAYGDLSHGRMVPTRVSFDSPTTTEAALLRYLTAHRGHARYLVATQAAYTAEPLLRDSTQPILVMGGFTGLTPYPTAKDLAALVSSHQVRYSLLTTQRPATPATRWVRTHCAPLPPLSYGGRPGGTSRLFDCAAGT